MNYYHPNKLWMEFRDSTRESSPLSTPRPVPDPTPCDVHEGLLIRKITASIFSDSRMSAFTTNQASGAYAPYGFIRLKCTTCGAEKLVAFSCKKRGFCPSCCAKRMAEAATHLTQNVLHLVPYRQFVVSFPIPLRYWLHTNKRFASEVFGLVTSEIHRYYIVKATAAGITDATPGSISRRNEVPTLRRGSSQSLRRH